MNETDPTLTAALKFANLGWYVFPVVGKAPQQKFMWRDHSTNDPQEIVLLFMDGNYGIGLDMGKSGLVAVDGDRLEETHEWAGDVLDGHTSWRGNPERQSWLFKQRAGVPLGCPKHPGGEIKGIGGYMVMPPSPHPEHGQYEWITNVLPTTIPESLEQKILDLSGSIATARRGKHEQIALTDGTPCPRLERILERMRANLDGEGRHDAALVASMAIIGLGQHEGSATALDTAETMFRSSVAADRGDAAADEWDRMVDGAHAKVELTDDTCSGPRCGAHDDGIIGDAPLLHPVFDAHPHLAHIRTAAESVMVNPWGLLGACIAVVTAETPNDWVIETYGGMEASLNQYIGLVGGSGTGKSTVIGVAKKMLASTATPANPSSGEGLLQAFMETVKDPETKQVVNAMKPDPRVLCSIDEIQQLDVMRSRSGSSLDAILLTLWSSGGGMTTTSVGERTRVIPDGMARLGLIAGVQPSLSGPLVTATDSGYAQRWVLLPIKPTVVREGVEYPGPLKWRATNTTLNYRVHVDKAVLDEMYAEHVAAAKAPDDGYGDPNAHVRVLRLKVAAAIGSLTSGQPIVSEWTWAIAGEILAESLETFAGLRAFAARTAERAASLQVFLDVRRDELRDETQHERGQSAVLRLIARHSTRDACIGGCTMRCLTNGLKGWNRENREILVQDLLTSGRLVEEQQERSGNPVTAYVVPDQS